MKKSNLAKKVGQGLAILATGMLIGSGICYSKETNPKGYVIPDLSKAKVVGEPRYDDLTEKIEGPETRLDHYRTDKKDIYKASVKGHVFLYAIHDLETGELCAVADLNGDGIYETKYSQEDLTYDQQGNFPAKKDLPPDWALTDFF